MASVDAFLSTFNELDETLRRIAGKTGQRPRPSFGKVLDDAARIRPSIRGDTRQWLKRVKDFRNTISHDSDWPDHVAEPTAETVERLREILATVREGPETVLDLSSPDPRAFQVDDGLADALRFMGENDFSQVIVSTSDGLELLTSEGVARWVELRIDERGDFIAEGVTIGDALAHDLPGSGLIWSRGRNAVDAYDAFAGGCRGSSPRLFGIIVTQNGSPDETPLGIVTPWDVFRSPE